MYDKGLAPVQEQGMEMYHQQPHMKPEVMIPSDAFYQQDQQIIDG